MKKIIYIGFIGSIILFGCTNVSTEDLIEAIPEPDPTVKITYDADIKSIITDNCTSCHGDPAQGAPTSYVTYEQVSNNINSIISRINSSGPTMMPPTGQIPLVARQLIDQWKEDGLLEN